MNNVIGKMLSIINDPALQEGLSTAAQAEPKVSFAVKAFKAVVHVADEIAVQHILMGIASGLNQEMFINELKNYIMMNERNAEHIANTLRKALLADSPNACTLMGRMIADHIRDKTPYDRYDVIVAHALENATDEDLPAFRTMMNSFDGEKVHITDQNTADWCIANRLFANLPSRAEKGSLIMAPGVAPTEGARRLLKYIEETKQLFRESLV